MPPKQRRQDGRRSEPQAPRREEGGRRVRAAGDGGARDSCAATRQSPYKMRLVIDQIRGKDVNEALALLTFSKKHAAKQIEKTLSRRSRTPSRRRARRTRRSTWTRCT